MENVRSQQGALPQESMPEAPKNLESDASKLLASTPAPEQTKHSEGEITDIAKIKIGDASSVDENLSAPEAGMPQSSTDRLQIEGERDHTEQGDNNQAGNSPGEGDKEDKEDMEMSEILNAKVVQAPPSLPVQPQGEKASP